MQTPTFEFAVNPLTPALSNCTNLYLNQVRVYSGLLYATRCLGIAAGICLVAHHNALSDAQDLTTGSIEFLE